MRRSPHQDALDRVFAQLPRQGASEDFTDRVLGGLEVRRIARRTPLRWSMAAAAVTLVLLVGTLALQERREKQSASALARKAEQLRQEHRILTDELASLRLLVAENPSLVYLGGDETIDLVFDLAPVTGRIEPARTRPADFRASQTTQVRRKE